MAIEDMDPSLIQDFLTESNELIEHLDADLIKLEDSTDGPESKDLLDGIFRALHTIKGAASFLSMTALTTFAHAAEDALNKLRKGEIGLNEKIMDALLRSVDVLRGMLEEVAQGQPITDGPADLIAELHAIAGHTEAGQPDTPAAGAASSSDDAASEDEAQTFPDGHTEKPILLPPEKADLLEFMATDLLETLPQIDQSLSEAQHQHSREDASEHINGLAGPMRQTAEFFELRGLNTLIDLMAQAAAVIPNASEQPLAEILVRLTAIRGLIEDQAHALARSVVLGWPLETFQQRLETLYKDEPLPDDVAGKHENDAQKVLELDGVIRLTDGSRPTEEAAANQSASQPPDAAGTAQPNAPDARPPNGGREAKTRNAAMGDQTVRVEVGRLEALLNLVGQLVLNKNRVVAQARRLPDYGLAHEVVEDFNDAASELDHLTSELQVGVMRTRMQPLAKLFDRYPRVIRDMARKTDKKLHLEIVGKETEVDKTVLENLADPLVHVLRNSADHGIERPEKRAELNKSEMGTIRLSAEHQGSHVRVEIADDGKGLDREVIGNKAIERGLVNPEQLASMSDEDVFRFIFAAGFSTAEQVTDLSGRGVGMDVVRTNINKLNGAINISSEKGNGTTIEILIPLTVAIMPAMIVGVGRHLYAIPLANIIEIVRPEQSAMYSVKGQPVMKLRDKVLPLLDMRAVLQEASPDSDRLFAVIVGVGQQRVGLMVDRLIGQQEIVIKSLDDCYATAGPFSGATIREDGGVSLILDINQLIRQAQASDRAAA